MLLNMCLVYMIWIFHIPQRWFQGLEHSKGQHGAVSEATLLLPKCMPCIGSTVSQKTNSFCCLEVFQLEKFGVDWHLFTSNVEPKLLPVFHMEKWWCWCWWCSTSVVVSTTIDVKIEKGSHSSPRQCLCVCFFLLLLLFCIPNHIQGILEEH